MATWAIAWLLWFGGSALAAPTTALPAPPLLLSITQASAPQLGDLPIRRLPRHVDQHRVSKEPGDEEQQPAEDAGEDQQTAGAEPGLPPLGRFRVQITAPRTEDPLSGRVRITAAVDADRPKDVAAVDFFIDGRLLFSDAEPPYELLWDAGRPSSHSIEVRAYGPGRQMVTDLLDLNQLRGQVEQTAAYAARVERVEVYVRVEGRDPDAPPLTLRDFELLEEGISQRVVSVERVVNLPIAVGLLIDCSGSMVDRLDNAIEAGGTFIEGLMTQDQDKAFVMGFSDVPVVLQGFTNDTERLEGALDLVQRGRYTALYDSVIAASESFAGVDGRRALVVLTDGHDQGSSNRLQASLAAAQAENVAIYPVGIELSPRYLRERWVLNRFARETGGRAWFLERPKEAERIYQWIADDLRAQYRITYAPVVRGGAGEWRSIEVRLTGDRPDEVKVRARPGYYSR